MNCDNNYEDFEGSEGEGFLHHSTDDEFFDMDMNQTSEEDNVQQQPMMENNDDEDTNPSSMTATTTTPPRINPKSSFYSPLSSASSFHFSGGGLEDDTDERSSPRPLDSSSFTGLPNHHHHDLPMYDQEEEENNNNNMEDQKMEENIFDTWNKIPASATTSYKKPTFSKKNHFKKETSGYTIDSDDTSGDDDDDTTTINKHRSSANQSSKRPSRSSTTVGQHRRTSSADFAFCESSQQQPMSSMLNISINSNHPSPNTTNFRHHRTSRSIDNYVQQHNSSPTTTTTTTSVHQVQYTSQPYHHTTPSSSTSVQILSQSLPSHSFMIPKIDYHKHNHQPSTTTTTSVSSSSSSKHDPSSSNRSYSLNGSRRSGTFNHISIRTSSQTSTPTIPSGSSADTSNNNNNQPQRKRPGHKRVSSATNIYFASHTNGCATATSPNSMHVQIVTEQLFDPCCSHSEPSSARRGSGQTTTTTLTVVSTPSPSSTIPRSPNHHASPSPMNGDGFTIEEVDDDEEDLPSLESTSVTSGENLMDYSNSSSSSSCGGSSREKLDYRKKKPNSIVTTNQERNIMAVLQSNSHSEHSESPTQQESSIHQVRRMSVTSPNILPIQSNGTRTSIVVQTIKVKWNDMASVLPVKSSSPPKEKKKKREKRITRRSVVVNKSQVSDAIAKKRRERANSHKKRFIDVCTQTGDDDVTTTAENKTPPIIETVSQIDKVLPCAVSEVPTREPGYSSDDEEISSDDADSEPSDETSSTHSDTHQHHHLHNLNDYQLGDEVYLDGEYLLEIDGGIEELNHALENDEEIQIEIPMTFIVTKSNINNTSGATPLTARQSTIIQIPNITMDTFHPGEGYFSDYTHTDNQDDNMDSIENLIESNTTLDDLKKKIISQKYTDNSVDKEDLPDVNAIILKYRDAEGDLVTIRSTEELKIAYMEYLNAKKREREETVKIEELDDNDQPVFELEAHVNPEVKALEDYSNDSDGSVFSIATPMIEHDPFIIIASDFANSQMERTNIYVDNMQQQVVIVQQQVSHSPSHSILHTTYMSPTLSAASSHSHHHHHLYGNHSHQNFQHFTPHGHPSPYGYQTPPYSKKGLHKSFSEDDMFKPQQQQHDQTITKKTPPSDRFDHHHDRFDHHDDFEDVHIQQQQPKKSSTTRSESVKTTLNETPTTTSVLSMEEQQKALWYRGVYHFSSLYCPSFKEQQKLFDTIQIGKTLGAGSFSVVYSAMHILTGQSFAMKICYLDTLKKTFNTEVPEVIFSKIINEIKILEDIGDHANIVKFIASDLFKYVLFKDDKSCAAIYRPDIICMVMELVQGETLDVVIRKNAMGRLHENIVRIYAKQIFEALTYLHDKNIVHGDISPYNIMLNQWGVIKMIDFGLSKKLNADSTSDKQSKQINGTPMYIAPEVLESLTQGKPSDIFSAGCVILEALTGRCPYPAFQTLREPIQVFVEILKCRKSPAISDEEMENFFITETAKDFLIQCLEWDPEKRSTAKSLLDHPFLKPLTEEEVMKSLADSKFKSKEQKNIQKGNIATEHASNESVVDSESMMEDSDEGVEDDSDFYDDDDEEEEEHTDSCEEQSTGSSFQ